MTRREFIAALAGGAAASAFWPLAARAQQSAMPLISLFNSGIAATQTKNVTAFRQGLKEAGFVEGQNVAAEFHWGENQFDRLPALAAEVLARKPAVVVANILAALPMKAATATIPIVFTTGSDPVRDGLVNSLSRPGGNITGVVFITGALGTKRLELLRRFVPKATKIAMLLHPGTAETEAERTDVRAAAQVLGQPIDFLEVRTTGDIETAFTSLASRQVDGLLIGSGTFIANNRSLIVPLAARHKLPAMYATHEPVEIGGLMGYGASLPDAYHQAGRYTGRILKGENPGDLPVIQSSKFQFSINLRTAKALGLEFHPQLLATVDEVIE